MDFIYTNEIQCYLADFGLPQTIPTTSKGLWHVIICKLLRQ